MSTDYTPFFVCRKGRKGFDKPGDLIGLWANAWLDNENTDPNELKPVLITGVMGSSPKETRKMMNKLCDELNAVWTRWYRGEL